MVKIKKNCEYQGALLIQENFPEIHRPYKDGKNLREIAKILIDNPIKPIFKNNSVETIAKYLSIALQGGEFKGNYIEGLLDDDLEHYKSLKSLNGPGLKKMHKKNGYSTWSKREIEFLKEFYQKGYGPKKIFQLYKIKFKDRNRNSNAISSKLDSLREKGLIGKLRINWESEIGFYALSLLKLGGREGNYIREITDCLDNYFCDGKKVITKSKLINFYKRENVYYSEKKLSENLEDLIAA